MSGHAKTTRRDPAQKGAEYTCDACSRKANGKKLDEAWWSAPFGWFVLEEGDGAHACSVDCARAIRPAGAVAAFEIRVKIDPATLGLPPDRAN